MAHEIPGKAAGKQARAGSTQAGLAAGTRVMTLDGMIPVEFLTPGDRVVTRDGGISVLRGVKVTVHTDVRPVTISASVLGHDRPERDMTVAPDQPLLIRGWKSRALYAADSSLVPAARMADGQYITVADAPQSLRSFQLVFDAEHIIYAEGVELAMTTTVADIAA
ncbi:Hint domain-containing protein [Palleronia salina]|uniref:Hint domain-containing protein n=1 Tax=Palleronia salina TaxID=313368 RepID=A0A1M6ACL9_9RHOB|nr:Hint domain-containing protein [Palleronia salina]SHI34161.1 Hint domain-containing protein [Palleronia salina]